MPKLVLLISSLIPVAGLVLAAGVAGATQRSAGRADSDVAALSRVSAVGTPVALPAGDRRTTNLLQSGFRDVAQLAVHGGRSFYRLNLSSGKACYGSGPAGADWPLGVVICTNSDPGFPSPVRPILDASLVELGQSDLSHFVRVEGFAADGVAEVALRDENGTVVMRLPVMNNVYWSTEPPVNAVTLDALDASGRVLTSIP